MHLAPTVLIVEDDINLRETVQLYIEREGLRCLSADNGSDGIVQIQRFRPNLVVLDIMMPNLDGFQVCQQVRAAGCFVPILMLTARVEEGDRLKGLAIGADDYLTKPFSAKELLVVSLSKELLLPFFYLLLQLNSKSK